MTGNEVVDFIGKYIDYEKLCEAIGIEWSSCEVLDAGIEIDRGFRYIKLKFFRRGGPIVDIRIEWERDV